MIVRAKRKTNFTIISNVGMNDERLSLKAKGMLAYLLTKPDNWQVSDRHLATIGPDGRSAVQAALKELETFGYLVRKQCRNEQGQWAYVSYIYDEPWSEKPWTENPATEKPATENQAVISTEEVKTERTKTPAAPEATPTAETPLPSRVYGRLEKEWMTVNKTQADQHTALARRYGFDGWLAGFDATKRGSRSSASYVEKVILSELDKHPNGAGGAWSEINGNVPDYMK